ncbi:MAG TPA: hypothetical protein VFD39_09215, partial [Trueperaceae bacterium]|nr:hypothetical protein [Trueperaceae bacterium]
MALLIVSCSGPSAVQEASLLTDADLDAATQLPAASSSLLASGPQSVATSDAINSADRSGAPLLSGAALDAASAKGEARGQRDLGGFMAYVEQKGEKYSIRLVDLNDENSPERRGDYVVYSGKRVIQSVAVSRDGMMVAFVAETKDGDYDLYLLDALRNKVASTRTPEADERDVSMSLDGSALAWQGGTAQAPSLAWFHEELGGYLELDPATWGAVFGLPLTSVHPSISGNGFTVAFVDTSGELANDFGFGFAQGLTTIEFTLVDGTLTGLGLVLQYIGDDLSFPSLDYAADTMLFFEVFDGVPFLSLLDLESGDFADLLSDLTLDHPFLTADGDYVTFSFEGDAYLVDLTTGNVAALSTDAKTTDSATYWARGDFATYSGRNDEGVFVRPGDDLPAEGRTVGYHVEEFRPIADDFYEVLSVQNYDGYLNLYVGDFNP